MSKIKNTINLLRVRQYYKNILLFIGPFFGVSLLNFSLYPTLLLSFLVLCAISSINYIINDIYDIEVDKLYPEKLDKRPLASGELSISFAWVITALLSAFILINLIFIIQNLWFSLMTILILITGQLYNFIFKNFSFLDIFGVSFIYIWRTLAGCFLINIFISPWLLVSIFELALFLVISKRKADLTLLGLRKALEYKKSYKRYNCNLLYQLQFFTAVILITTYTTYIIWTAFYTSLIESTIFVLNILLTIPLFPFLITTYIKTSNNEPEIARCTEKVFIKPKIVITGIFFVIMLGLSFYGDKIFKLA